MALNPSPLAVVIPALNEASGLPLLLADLARHQGLIAELVVVDGGSRDGTAALARLAGAQVQHAGGGRGGQLVAGLAITTAPWLWLLHADARLPAFWPARLRALLLDPALTAAANKAWYGDLRVALPGAPYRLLEALVALRSRLGQRPYGDQGLLLSRAAYQQAGGLQPLALMEDLEFAERFGRSGRFCSLGLPITVDGRRWRHHGLLATSWRNARLRRAWRRGCSPEVMLQRYYNR